MQIQKHKAKKSLGQNFLKSNLALKKIVEAGEISPDDTILEIGPGKGALTEKLLEKSDHVIAIEKDNALFNFLNEKFEKEIKEKKLILLNEDILKFSITNYELRIKDYKIIANIPYNITGAILKKFLANKNQPERMILMVQNEVAKRIMGKDGESILSISVKAYGNPKIIMKVPARYFSPAPKVDSAVIAIKNISKKNFTLLETPSSFGHSPLAGGEKFEEKFWEIVRAGFAHKRKKLSSNLKNYLGNACVLELGNKRAEELSLEDWLELVKNAEN